jgi:UDP-glucose-4-epimerase GalE
LIVLVVGGAGYIGSHAARALRRQGHEAVIYDNLSTGYAQLAAGFELIQGELADTAKLSMVLRRVNAVMHFAAHAYVGESVENPRKYFRNNIEAGLALLNTCLDCGVRKFIFSSTCAVYGVPLQIPISEDSARLPINPYGVSKLFFERALEAYDQAYGLRFASLRYFNAAGADEGGMIGEMHDPETHLIPLALEAAMGARPELEVFGADYPTPDGTCLRDYIHVNDLAEGHVAALQYLQSEERSIAVNLGTGRGISVKEILDAVERVTGCKVPNRIVPRRRGDPPALVADPSLAESLLHWKAERSLEQIVLTAWKWMQRQQTGVPCTLGDRRLEHGA